MKKRIFKKAKTARGFKDTFYYHRLTGLELHGDLELPVIKKYEGPIPKRIVNISRNPAHPEECFAHHYLFDYIFDGKNGIWYGCIEDSRRMNSYLRRVTKFAGLISPDYSVYVDLPMAHQIWNIYRDRVTCAWLRSKGLNVIFNLRWGDYRTYKYVFDGIEKHSVLAIGSHGLIRHPEDRAIFMNGFKEMARRLQPETIVLYGPFTRDIEMICSENNIRVIHFDCDQRETRKEK